MSKLGHGEHAYVPSCSEPVAEVGDLGSAEALIALLRAEAIQAEVEPVGVVAGFPRAFRVLVDPTEAHRARWVLQPSGISDAELDFLATGQLGSGDDS